MAGEFSSDVRLGYFVKEERLNPVRGGWWSAMQSKPMQMSAGDPQPDTLAITWAERSPI